MKNISVTIDNKELTLSNLEKIYWPEDNITKAELIDYYHRSAVYLLPHLKDRPMTMKRFPDGINGKSFYQKDCPEHAPDWVPTVPVKSSDNKTIDFILVNNLPTLIWMANLGCIEMHPWLSRYMIPDKPSQMVFDLDPNVGSGWEEVLKIAPMIKEGLEKYSLKGFPKTSGASGLHIYVPIQPKYTFKQVQTAAGSLARAITRVLPQIATVERTVAKRGPRVYVDYLQNASGKTIASVYSVRPRPGAPVSFPVTWEAIEKKEVHPQDFNLRNVPALLETQGDLFSVILKEEQNIDQLLSLK